MKRKSIIDSISSYCETASPDAISLLQQIVNGYAKKKPVAATATAAASRTRKSRQPETPEEGKVVSGAN